MNGVDGLKAAVLIFIAAILQVSIFSQAHVLGGLPDLLLVMLVAVSLLRGAIMGALGGFFIWPATLATIKRLSSVDICTLSSIVTTYVPFLSFCEHPWRGRQAFAAARVRGGTVRQMVCKKHCGINSWRARRAFPLLGQRNHGDDWAQRGRG